MSRFLRLVITAPCVTAVLMFVPLLAGASCDSGKTETRRIAGQEALRVGFEQVYEGLEQPTDIQFFQSETGSVMVVLQQGGEARWFRKSDGRSGVLFSAEVVGGGELGLLGIAFHPKFGANGLFYTNRTVTGGEAALSRIDEWRLPGARLANAPAQLIRNIMQVSQPFSNHNAGQLQFGPDGYLYIGWGDGGAGGDPEENGQNPGKLLGKMLRIDIDKQSNGKAYAVPSDNPFVGKSGVLPEIWALGFRNPWRFSFDPGNRLVVADVGQNRIEEVDIVEAGKNYGWNVMEGSRCFEPPADCGPEKYALPVYEYTHSDGHSITGGYVYTGNRIPGLKGKYVFGDLNGKIWAFELPSSANGKVTAVSTLAETGFMPTTFGRDSDGELYVADYSNGIIYQLVPAAPAEDNPPSN